jgi:hypothetical protein
MMLESAKEKPPFGSKKEIVAHNTGGEKGKIGVISVAMVLIRGKKERKY